MAEFLVKELGDVILYIMCVVLHCLWADINIWLPLAVYWSKQMLQQGGKDNMLPF